MIEPDSARCTTTPVDSCSTDTGSAWLRPSRSRLTGAAVNPVADDLAHGQATKCLKSGLTETTPAVRRRRHASCRETKHEMHSRSRRTRRLRNFSRIVYFVPTARPHDPKQTILTQFRRRPADETGSQRHLARVKPGPAGAQSQRGSPRVIAICPWSPLQPSTVRMNS